MSSDQPLGPGWWMASDGRYYPPSLHHDPAHQAAYASAAPVQSAPVAATQPAAAVAPTPEVSAHAPIETGSQSITADPFAPMPQATAALPQMPASESFQPQPGVAVSPPQQAQTPTPQTHNFAIPGEQTAFPTVTPGGPAEQAWVQPGQPMPGAGAQQLPGSIPATPTLAPQQVMAPAPVAPSAPIAQAQPVSAQPPAPVHPASAPMPTYATDPQGASMAPAGTAYATAPGAELPTGSMPDGMQTLDASPSKLGGLGKSPLIFAGAGLLGLLVAVLLGSMLFGGGGGDPVASPDSLPMVDGDDTIASDDLLDPATSGVSGDTSEGAMQDDAGAVDTAPVAGGSADDASVDADAAQAYKQWAAGEGATVSNGVAELLTLITAMDSQLAAGLSPELDESCVAAEQRSAGLLADPAAFPYMSDPDEIHKKHVQDFAEATKRAASLCLVGDLPGATENAAIAIASSWEISDREFALLDQG